MTAHWRWTQLALDWVIGQPQRLDQIRFAIVKRFELISKNGKTTPLKSAGETLNYLLFQLSNPVMVLALATARDLGALTLSPELDFLQKRGAFRLALLAEFALLTAMRRSALDRVVEEMSACLPESDLVEGERLLERFSNDKASTAELLPVESPPLLSHLRPAMPLPALSNETKAGVLVLVG